MSDSNWDAETWLDNEARFNHDWLGNGLIVNLRGVESSLKHGDLSQSTFDRAFRYIEQWSDEKVEAKLILDQLCSALCYTRFIRSKPLNQLHIETREELELLVSQIWQSELERCADFKNAKTAISTLDSACRGLLTCFSRHEIGCVKRGIACRKELDAALVAAEKLSKLFTTLSRLARPCDFLGSKQ